MLTVTITQEQIDALDAQYGRVVIARCKEGTPGPWVAAFRKPARMEWKRYQAEVKKENADALENLCRTICVYPSKEDFMTLLEEHPALPIACSEAIAEIAEVEGRLDTVK
jgi:hypothetical protein